MRKKYLQASNAPSASAATATANTMSFSADQFMQVKCKFQLTSETESAESIHSNNERVRICCSVDFDKNSTLIVLVCSNEMSNNHIVAYYVEKRLHSNTNQLLSVENSLALNSFIATATQNHTQQQLLHQQQPSVTFAQLAQQSISPKSKSPGHTRSHSRPRIIVKQIYYHNYNEDIVAASLSESGSSLTLVSASSTIYILPIKNILLNLHSKQLRSSQGKSMYFYDAACLINCCSVEEPVAVVHWESFVCTNKSFVIVAGHGGELSFVNVQTKKETNRTSIDEPIQSLKIIRDRFSYSLLITCQSFNQYRLALEPIKDEQPVSPTTSNSTSNSDFQMIHTNQQDSESILARLNEKDLESAWNEKPSFIKIHNGSNVSSTQTAAAALQRVFIPTSRFATRQASSSLSGGHRERSLPLIIYQAPSLIGVIDVLGVHQKVTTSQGNGYTGLAERPSEPRLLRFYSNKSYYYRPQKPLLVCKLNLIDADEMITNLLLTDRFIALTTDRDRCLINSRNCCNIRNIIEMDSPVKEITFANEERIISLIKSPLSNDQDNIIDSFLLITTHSIYSIEARQNCREMFINLLDSHLAIKSTRNQQSVIKNIFTATAPNTGPKLNCSQNCNNLINVSTFNITEYTLVEEPEQVRKNSQSNLLINSFLSQRDEVYERITHDSRAFSILFKLELNSLYEAYGDRLLQRGQYELANRFFQIAQFNHTRILGKYIRLGAYKQSIEYASNVLSDENEILEEKERIDLSKAAFECLLAKTLIERSKLELYGARLKQDRLKRLIDFHDNQNRATSPSKATSNCKRLPDPFQICDHSPRGQMSKLSATTIIMNEAEFEEGTLTSSLSQNPSNSIDQHGRLECERALIDFVKKQLPSSLYSYAMTQLVDFNLLDLIEIIARTDTRIHSLLRILIRLKDDTNRIIFRDGRHEELLNQISSSQRDMIQIDTTNLTFLQFLTSPNVNMALVKDISLTCDYLGYQHTLVQFRKYSFAGLRQLYNYKTLVSMRREQQVEESRKKRKRRTTKLDSESAKETTTRLQLDHDDENANDVDMRFKIVENNNNNTDNVDDDEKLFARQYKKSFESIFIEFLSACLDESTEDSCRLWFNYINFYLNHIGTLEELEEDILNLMNADRCDCRLAITLYKAIHREESTSYNKQKSSNGLKKSLQNRSITSSTRQMFLAVENVATTHNSSPIDSMKQVHNLAKLFRNEFLMKLLERTLDLVPKAADLDALSVVAMC